VAKIDAPNVQEPIFLLKVELLADDGQLVVLELLKSLLAMDVGNYSARINHPWTEEPVGSVVRLARRESTPHGTIPFVEIVATCDGLR
jgi:hypothetical protein